MELQQQVPCSDAQSYFFDGEALVEGALSRRKFAELEQLYEQWCKGTDRLPDGRWKLVTYGSGLAKDFEGWNTWTKYLDAIKAWNSASPASEAAQYAEAVYWHTYAWKARGTGYARSISKEGWELYRERLSKSEEIVDALMASTPRCAAPYHLKIILLTDRGASEKDLRVVYTEAVRRYPEYHSLYFAMARHYEPKWGGSAAQYERFAIDTARATRGFEGMGMYSRLYWLVDTESELPFRGERVPLPSWKNLRAGYEDLVRKYPSSLHNLGKYAGVACRSNDSALYRSLRTRIAGYEHSAEMFDPVDVCDRRHRWEPVATVTR